jgi:indolepyruvate ferredoxin oxidoreductase, alpha subunit
MTRGIDAPAGQELLLLGNEAIARAAIEAGASVAAAYPGNPSSEIIATLGAAGAGMHVEWSVNEKVAVETAAAASFCGLRALAAMKQNGLNVASDFLLNLNLCGTKGGLVVVVCDDPSGLSSTNEQDSRGLPRVGDLPLLEPWDVPSAREMTLWAFELSEQLGLPVIVRSVTRISHASANVRVGPLPGQRPLPSFDRSRLWIGLPVGPKHRALHEKLARARELFESCAMNVGSGPDRAELLVIAAGAGGNYAREAVDALGARDRVAMLRLATTWPLPERLLISHLQRASSVLVLEEIDPYLETDVRALAAQHGGSVGIKEFHGRASGLLRPEGELNPEIVTGAIASLLSIRAPARDPAYEQRARAASALVPARTWGLCAGCPHRASYWAISQALALDGRQGFVVGDIGCYSLGFGPSGWGQMRTMQAMGSGAGLASGMGALRRLGLQEPAVAVCGDSTFFHAVLPALLNARYNDLDLLLLVLDNEATAMTGFQPHAGTGVAAQDRPANAVAIETLCAALGARVASVDPFDVARTIETLTQMLEASGLRVLVLRQRCALLRSRQQARRRAPRIDAAQCRGEACGCSRFCTRVFRCPGLVWNTELGVAAIDDALCNRCGVCVQLCPAGAIAEGEPC